MSAALHDPGGKVKTRLPAGMTGWAEFTPCGRYRTVLLREWKDGVTRTGLVLFIGMNPSTADAEGNDPTVSREIGFTRRWGFGRYVKMNIGDYRATNPKDLARATVAFSDQNLPMIRAWASGAARIVMAHGILPPPLRDVGATILDCLKQDRRELWCLGFTQDGSPRHPLYVRGDTELVRYPRGTR